MDSWEVLLHFIAGLMSHSNYDVSTQMLHSFNVKENEIRIAERNKPKLQQKSDKERKEMENHKRKQIASDFGWKQQMAKDSKKKKHHMSNKISLVNKKPRVFICANCHGRHHNSGNCIEVMYAKPPQNKKQKSSVMTVDKIHSLF
jgi:rubrerythrin